MSSEINLITRNQKDFQKEKRLRQLKIASYISLVLVAALSIFLFILNLTSPIVKMQKQEQSLSSQLSTLQGKDAKLSLVKSRIVDINKIRSNSLYFFPIVNVLKEKLPAEITLTSIDVNNSSVAITLTSKSLDVLDKYLNDTSSSLIKDKKVQTITLDSLVSNARSSVYVASIKLSLL